jgi:hypothetical protein
MQDDQLWLSVTAKNAWLGKVYFDTPRHKTFMHLPLDWPRINQAPQWFTVKHGQQYLVQSHSTTETFTGKQLEEGIELKLSAGERIKWHIKPSSRSVK